jgi:hypothetical protein
MSPESEVLCLSLFLATPHPNIGAITSTGLDAAVVGTDGRVPGIYGRRRDVGCGEIAEHEVTASCSETAKPGVCLGLNEFIIFKLANSSSMFSSRAWLSSLTGGLVFLCTINLFSGLQTHWY